MQKHKLGRTNLEVSAIGFGCYTAELEKRTGQ
jgi:aryl-alcohol dehydrogenase-like predicted oxidoreductase